MLSYLLTKMIGLADKRGKQLHCQLFSPVGMEMNFVFIVSLRNRLRLNIADKSFFSFFRNNHIIKSFKSVKNGNFLNLVLQPNQ